MSQLGKNISLALQQALEGKKIEEDFWSILAASVLRPSLWRNLLPKGLSKLLKKVFSSVIMIFKSFEHSQRNQKQEVQCSVQQ